MPDHLVLRDLERLHFDGAPVTDWEGETLQAVYERLLRFMDGAADAARSSAERAAFGSLDERPRDDADFMLFLMRSYDKGFRHCDLLIIGAGPSGLMAALTAGRQPPGPAPAARH